MWENAVLNIHSVGINTLIWAMAWHHEVTLGPGATQNHWSKPLLKYLLIGIETETSLFSVTSLTFSRTAVVTLLWFAEGYGTFLTTVFGAADASLRQCLCVILWVCVLFDKMEVRFPRKPSRGLLQFPLNPHWFSLGVFPFRLLKAERGCHGPDDWQTRADHFTWESLI